MEGIEKQEELRPIIRRGKKKGKRQKRKKKEMERSRGVGKIIQGGSVCESTPT